MQKIDRAALVYSNIAGGDSKGSTSSSSTSTVNITITA